jgi:hypothetical protein
MSETEVKSPKTFISYSWSSLEHEEWVLNLASELVESGVDVILDKWALGEGADKYAFMERMVTDPSVSKVIAVCDRLYSEKADDRKGGVGTETQIMSREVYEQVAASDGEQKFVAVVTEKDENGEAFVPTFLKNRIYIDMSDEAFYVEKFEQLLRWIYDKPLHTRPELGKPPAYIVSQDVQGLGTSAPFRRAEGAIRQNKHFALVALQEYFDTVADNMESFRIEPMGDNFYDEVVGSIESFLPYRDEVVDLFLTIARYRSDSEAYEAVHAFFERILPYGFWPEGRSQWNEMNADNFKFVLNELFLYVTAALLKYRRFERVDELLERGFYFSEGSLDVPGGGLVPFTFFNKYMRSLEFWNQQQETHWLSPRGQLLKERATRADLRFDDLIQAEMVLFIRDAVRPEDEDYRYEQWYPSTLLYAWTSNKPFELFARAQSGAFFDQLRVALGIDDKSELSQLVDDYRTEKRRPPSWNGRTLSNLPELLNLKKIDTRP